MPFWWLSVLLVVFSGWSFFFAVALWRDYLPGG